MNTQLFLAGAALLLSSLSAHGQEAEMGPRPSVDRLPDVYTPETLPAGRQMGGPAGDVLAKPADPTVPAVGPSSDPDPEGRELTSTNVIIPPVTEGEDDPGNVLGGEGIADEGEEQEYNADLSVQGDLEHEEAAEPAPLHVAPGQNIIGTRGGAALAAYQEYGQDLERYVVVAPTGEEVGEVEGVILNLSEGRIEGLRVEHDGVAGLGEESAGIPWAHVRRADKIERRLVLGAGPALTGLEGERLPQGYVYAEQFAGAAVFGENGEKLGDAAGVVVNLETGDLDTLMLSAGGFLGMGDKVFDIPWEQVAAIDPEGDAVRLAVGPEFLRPNPEYGELEGPVAE